MFFCSSFSGRPPPRDRRHNGQFLLRCNCLQTATSSLVGSKAGAPTVGSGGDSTTFMMALSPAPMVTFPAPATSHAACGFPALRAPAHFASRVMGPIRLERLSAAGSALGTHQTTRGLHRTTAYSIASSRSPGARRRAPSGAESSSPPSFACTRSSGPSARMQSS